MIHYDEDLLEKVKQYFGKERIATRYVELRLKLCNYLSKFGMLDKVHIDEGLLKSAVLDYFVDIYRLKIFHSDIEKINVEKIYGYTAFWLLRRKPILLKPSSNDEECLHINEKVVMTMLLVNMLAESGYEIGGLNEAQDDYATYFAFELFYHFCYRVFTQQSIELALGMFASGCGIAKT